MFRPSVRFFSSSSRGFKSSAQAAVRHAQQNNSVKLMRQPSGGMVHAVVMLSGPNRVGIVGSLTNQVFEPLNASVGRTRMTTLGSDFSVLARVAVPGSNAHHLETLMKEKFGDLGFATGVRIQSADSKATQQDIDELMAWGSDLKLHTKRVRLIGGDTEGVLGNLTETLSSLQANVVTLTSDSFAAPHSGYAIFTVDAVVTTNNQAELEDAMDALATKLGVDISVEDHGE